MDKKAKYQQPATKGSATEAKKNQDITNSKPYPKSTRRREPAGANSYQKNDQPRNSNPQKTKNFDKRPKPKGQYHGGSKEDSKVVDDESAELGSVMVQGSKKQNLNHLLNFHYAPREVQGGWNYGQASGYSSNNYKRSLPAVQRHKYSKEQFLQANCQFVVTAKGDYSLHLYDADALVDWKLIEQIRLHSSDNLSCPICLCPPVAGKMTRCGHVYCWPCILHYLALSDKSWRECPICFEPVNKSDLKSVVEITEHVVNIGDQITLRLMRREKKTLLAVPVDEIESSPPSTFLSVSKNSRQQIYSKLLLAQNDDILNIIESERRQLEIELFEDLDSPETVFIDKALAELSHREKLLFESLASPLAENKVIKPIVSRQTIEQENQEDIENVPYETENYDNTQFSERLCTADNQSTCDLDRSIISSNSAETTSNSQKFYYFYQADSGQHIYLHAMNVKMLEMQYGSLERSPRRISGKLLEKEVGSFTEDLRRRMRYLCHLPVTSEFEIVEIELSPPIVSADVMTHFKDQIISRRKNRERRDREERKREKKITEEENRRMGKYPTPKVHIESRKHFPQFQSETSENNVPSPPDSAVVSSISSSPLMSSFDDIASTVGGDINNWSVPSDQGPSFAQMLRTNGSKKTDAWPSLSSSRRAEAVSIGKDREDPIDPEMEEYVPPVYRPILEDAFAQALKEKSKLKNKGDTSANNVTSSKKKKKKGKGTVLFATNMARAP